jgi:hypothetical protein
MKTNSGMAKPYAEGPNVAGDKPGTRAMMNKRTALTHDLPPGFEAGKPPSAMKRAPGPHVKEPKKQKG